MTTILFRLDAGRDIGLGHLQRCLSLAAALDRRSLRSFFAVHGRDVPSAWLEEVGADWMQLDRHPNPPDDARAVAELARRRDAAAIVVDTYRADAAYLERLAVAHVPVITIDDFAAFPFPNELVVNFTPYAKTLSFSSTTGATRFLLGPAYAILREGFKDLPARSARQDVENILVTMGGTDGRNLTPSVLEALEGLPGGFAVTVLVGPLHARLAEIETFARRSRRSVRIVRGTREPHGWMGAADLAVSAAGQTLYELAATGTPAVALTVADNQIRNAAAFSQAGTSAALSLEREDWRTRLAQELQALLQDAPRRRRMAEAGQRLVDGRGADRVAAEIGAIVEPVWN